MTNKAILATITSQRTGRRIALTVLLSLGFSLMLITIATVLGSKGAPVPLRIFMGAITGVVAAQFGLGMESWLFGKRFGQRHLMRESVVYCNDLQGLADAVKEHAGTGNPTLALSVHGDDQEEMERLNEAFRNDQQEER
jgi:hypothetical protein